MAAEKTQATAGKAAIRNQIEENLKRVYETVLQEPVPGRFAELLAQLRAQEQEAGR
ncbi:hypothetical protein LHP98_00380 [Rhodobacter sp. Har01]|uniref:NepR family anti-sigma factor n=1 Tax=Rhodobacter sp. Har01 TaxID=2883999 RepID=UPI001D096A61|nr:NepR family anti-sigma factor [Rhodobacter sp. Har01]MCB6176585.1 hypothetical protein [Rhodobacter sp. Har01]